jgi:hypothetical protein
MRKILREQIYGIRNSAGCGKLRGSFVGLKFFLLKEKFLLGGREKLLWLKSFERNLGEKVEKFCCVNYLIENYYGKVFNNF